MEEKIRELLKVYKSLKKGNEGLSKSHNSDFIKGKITVIDYIIEDLEELLEGEGLNNDRI